MFGRRSDGDLLRDLPLTRQVVPYVMRSRPESAVYVEQRISIRRADEFLRAFNAAHPDTPADLFHLWIYATRESIRKYPSMNRFVAGGRFYQRRGLWFSYSVKKKLRVEEASPLVVIKRQFPWEESFEDMVAGMHQQLHDERYGGPSHVDKELRLILMLPGPARRLIFLVGRILDRLGLFPRSFIEQDPMFASVFFSNFASLGMDALYHHLYEYGTISVFSAMGRPQPEPDSPTSGPERRRFMIGKWTFDERAEDGLAGALALRVVKQLTEDPEAFGLSPHAGAPFATSRAELAERFSPKIEHRA